MNTFPNHFAVFRVFAENVRQDIETAEIGQNPFPFSDFVCGQAAETSFVVSNARNTTFQCLSEVFSGQPLGNPPLVEIRSVHIHITNSSRSVLIMSSRGRSYCE